ncbi:MAG: XRE family transcriptional regulator [Firmicutes bacterium HGW-Firmicutes-14]|nr:MAG: XRE family transcriptional regulator [Firmicutes bacterium HGW-Firmicutes-14]
METVGEKIRQIRTEKEITMTELAKRTGFSQSYLSQVERNLINPSVGALQKIAKELALPTAYFFQNTDEINNKQSPVRVVKKNQRKGLVYPESQMKYQLLSPDLQGPIELLFITASPGGDTGEDEFVHIGHEYGVVLKGIMEVYVGGEKFLLEPGDSICFDSSLPHKWRNVGDEELEAVWAVTPPSF